MSCKLNYGLANFPACSGHGTCIDNYCHCDAGWSGVSDFVPIAGQDCDQNIALLRAFGTLMP